MKIEQMRHLRQHWPRRHQLPAKESQKCLDGLMVAIATVKQGNQRATVDKDSTGHGASL
jgi:hypothetical protein